MACKVVFHFHFFFCVFTVKSKYLPFDSTRGFLVQYPPAIGGLSSQKHSSYVAAGAACIGECSCVYQQKCIVHGIHKI